VSDGYVLTRQARRDVHRIIDYIAVRNPRAAGRLADELFAGFALLGERPEIGHRRTDLTSRNEMFLAVSKWYLVVHRHAAPVQILRVLDGRRCRPRSPMSAFRSLLRSRRWRAGRDQHRL
jgi:plasmid stabilization system protein ParE